MEIQPEDIDDNTASDNAVVMFQPIAYGRTLHPSLHAISQHSIDAGKNPQMDIVMPCLSYRSSVRIHADKSLQTPRRRDAVREE